MTTERAGLIAVAIIAASVVGTVMALVHAPPEAVRPCADSAEIRNGGSSRYTCPPGARLEAWPAGEGYFLAKCICPRGGAPVDAGAR